jgi:hypothetical protein
MDWPTQRTFDLSTAKIGSDAAEGFSENYRYA